MPIAELNPEDKTQYSGVSILGVDDSGPPGLSNFPSTFNRDAFFIWEKLLENPEYVKVKNNTKSASKMWFEIVQLYLKHCGMEGVFPFHSSTQQSRNDFLISHLKRARQFLADYIEESRFFDLISLRQVKRSYTITRTSFIVKCTAMLNPIEDPTFRHWLKKLPYPRMLPTTDTGRTYEHTLTRIHGVTVSLNTARHAAMELTYTIVCPTSPVYPSSARLPTNAQMAQFSEQVLWLPLVRTRRIKGAGTRLF